MKKNQLLTARRAFPNFNKGLYQFVSTLLSFIYFLLLQDVVQASTNPLLVFSALTPTTIQVASNGTAIVQYDIKNMSSKTHTLMMSPIAGLNQVTTAGNCANPFVLTPKATCTLTLEISGSQLSSQIIGGPKVCQQGPDGKPSPFQCYQPSPENLLNITITAARGSMLYAGTQNGNVYYSIDNGLSWTATNPPAGGYAVNSVVATSTILYAGAANGSVYSSFNNGNTWVAISTPAPGFAINGLYISTNNKLYIASASGTIFNCALNGTNCVTTAPPAIGFAVNSVYAMANSLYAASANGNVYYSNNNGQNWITINGQPDGSAVKTIYVAANTLYVGTASEYVYTSTSLTGGGIWNPYAQTVFSLFVNADGSQIFAGNQSGYVFSLTYGMQLGFVASTLINSVSLL